MPAGTVWSGDGGPHTAQPNVKDQGSSNGVIATASVATQALTPFSPPLRREIELGGDNGVQEGVANMGRTHPAAGLSGSSHGSTPCRDSTLHPSSPMPTALTPAAAAAIAAAARVVGMAAAGVGTDAETSPEEKEAPVAPTSGGSRDGGGGGGPARDELGRTYYDIREARGRETRHLKLREVQIADLLVPCNQTQVAAASVRRLSNRRNSRLFPESEHLGPGRLTADYLSSHHNDFTSESPGCQQAISISAVSTAPPLLPTLPPPPRAAEEAAMADARANTHVSEVVAEAETASAIPSEGSAGDGSYHASGDGAADVELRVGNMNRGLLALPPSLQVRTLARESPTETSGVNLAHQFSTPTAPLDTFLNEVFTTTTPEVVPSIVAPTLVPATVAPSSAPQHVTTTVNDSVCLGQRVNPVSVRSRRRKNKSTKNRSPKGTLARRTGSTRHPDVTSTVSSVFAYFTCTWSCFQEWRLWGFSSATAARVSLLCVLDGEKCL